MDAALAIWRSSALAVGSLVETYFVSRGLLVSPPPTIRFHGGVKHPSGGIWPTGSERRLPPHNLRSAAPLQNRLRCSRYSRGGATSSTRRRRNPELGCASGSKRA